MLDAGRGPEDWQEFPELGDGKIPDIFRPLKRALPCQFDLVPQACAWGYLLLPALRALG